MEVLEVASSMMVVGEAVVGDALVGDARGRRARKRLACRRRCSCATVFVGDGVRAFIENTFADMPLKEKEPRKSPQCEHAPTSARATTGVPSSSHLERDSA